MTSSDETENERRRKQHADDYATNSEFRRERVEEGFLEVSQIVSSRAYTGCPWMTTQGCLNRSGFAGGSNS